MRWLIILIAVIVVVGLAMFIFGLGTDEDGGAVESAALMLL